MNAEIPLDGLHWFFDHAETISDKSIDRIAKLGGGIAVQHRMAFQGEYFVERYGGKAAEHTPPIKRMHGCGREDLGRHRRHPRRVLRSLGLDRVARHRQDGWRLAALPGTQLPGPRDGAADVDGEHDLVLQRGEQEGQHQGRPACRSGRPRPRLLRGSRRRHPAPAIRPDDRGRQAGLWRRSLRRPCAVATARHAGLVAGPDLRRLPEAGRQRPVGAGGARRRHRPAAAPAAAASMVTPTRMPGAPQYPSPISEASGVRSAAPAGPFKARKR